MKIKRVLAVLTSLSLLTISFTACSGDSDKNSSESSDISDVVEESKTDEFEEGGTGSADAESMTIKWLSHYDLNPNGGDDRSIALTLFEDYYGGKIEWVPTTNDTKYDDLSKMVLGGEEVDMFPYEEDAVTEGICQNLYQPLDNYLDLDVELWSGMKETADKLMYKGEHYIVPYSITDPISIIYSRQMIKDEGLEDPNELYKQGKWDWEAFMSAMTTFKQSGSDRYGCTGWVAQALVQSTGKTMVNYDGSKFTNNLSDPDIEKAELMIEDIEKGGLYSENWHTYFPESGSVLFFAMAPWALEESNAVNPDSDMFIVPFPKADGADKHYTSCSFGAKMLLANSDKGEAVAKYIECERLAVTEEKYKNAAKKLALTPTLDHSGEKTKFLTEEQWDMIQTITDPSTIVPVFDYGMGMGAAMSKESLEYTSRGIIRNLYDGLISGYSGSPSTWEELKSSFTDAVDEEISKYN